MSKELIEVVVVKRCFVIEERDKFKLEKIVQLAIEEIEKQGLQAKVKYQAELDQKSDYINWYYSIMVYGVERKTRV
jgi:hypothetical protein